MPSQIHEVLVSLFQTRPELAPILLREALGVELPRYTEVRLESGSGAVPGAPAPPPAAPRPAVTAAPATPTLDLMVRLEARRRGRPRDARDVSYGLFAPSRGARSTTG